MTKNRRWARTRMRVVVHGEGRAYGMNVSFYNPFK